MDAFHQYLNRNLPSTKQKERQKVLSESIKLKSIQKDKAFYTRFDGSEMDNAYKRHFILTRKLGHKYEIPGSEGWQLHTEKLDQCYCCDQQIYSVFLWSPEWGPFDAESL